MLRTATCALALAPLLLAAACADPSGDSGATGTPVAATPADLPTVPAFDVGPTGVHPDLTVDGCDTGAGQATASGTIANSGKFARDLVVVVSWVVPTTGQVVAREIAQVDDVAPAASGPWSVSADLPGGAATVCTTAAYAGQLAAPEQ